MPVACMAGFLQLNPRARQWGQFFADSGSSRRQKEILDLPPVGNTVETLDAGVVGRGEKNAFPFEPLEMPVGVVNQVIG